MLYQKQRDEHKTKNPNNYLEYKPFMNRYYNGRSREDTINTPKRTELTDMYTKHVKFCGRRACSYSAIQRRINNGRTIEKCITTPSKNSEKMV